MNKYTVGNGQYIVYAESPEEVRRILSQELQRVDRIKEKVSNLLSQDGIALYNFNQNTSEENLNIHFVDEHSLIFDNPENAYTKGEVRQRSNAYEHMKYDLAYRYPDMQGHNADFRLAHEMGHLIINPCTGKRQTYDKETGSTQVAGLVRQLPDGNVYGLEMQENAVNLIAELAIRGEHSADDIMTGKVDVSEFNLYKQCDDLIKLLATAMRNDFSEEMTFEQLVNNKIDSFIIHSDGSREPANTFFYGILNDSSMIEKEFDSYMGKGSWRDLDTFITTLHKQDISKEKFDMIFKEAQGMIVQFAKSRMQAKHKEAMLRDGNDIPPLDNKLDVINQMAGIEVEEHTVAPSNEVEMPAGYSINQYGEIIRPQQAETISSEVEMPTGYSINQYGEIIRPPQTELQHNALQVINNNHPSFMQKIAQMLKKSEALMSIPFIENFVEKQLNNSLIGSSDGRFPQVQQMSNPEKIARMRAIMENDPQYRESKMLESIRGCSKEEYEEKCEVASNEWSNKKRETQVAKENQNEFQR